MNDGVHHHLLDADCFPSKDVIALGHLRSLGYVLRMPAHRSSARDRAVQIREKPCGGLAMIWCTDM